MSYYMAVYGGPDSRGCSNRLPTEKAGEEFLDREFGPGLVVRVDDRGSVGPVLAIDSDGRRWRYAPVPEEDWRPFAGLAQPEHVHPASMRCNVMCPANPNTVKRHA